MRLRLIYVEPSFPFDVQERGLLWPERQARLASMKQKQATRGKGFVFFRTSAHVMSIVSASRRDGVALSASGVSMMDEGGLRIVRTAR